MLDVVADRASALAQQLWVVSTGGSN
jgi:hypothetical protein